MGASGSSAGYSRPPVARAGPSGRRPRALAPRTRSRPHGADARERDAATTRGTRRTGSRASSRPGAGATTSGASSSAPRRRRDRAAGESERRTELCATGGAGSVSELDGARSDVDVAVAARRGVGAMHARRERARAGRVAPVEALEDRDGETPARARELEEMRSAMRSRRSGRDSRRREGLGSPRLRWWRPCRPSHLEELRRGLGARTRSVKGWNVRRSRARQRSATPRITSLDEREIELSPTRALGRERSARRP